MSDETKIHLDSINEALKMRNTDTTTLKRMPVAASPSASAAAHKTIKLKPLAPRSNPTDAPSAASVPANNSATVSKQVPAPSIMLSDKQKIQDQETATPQFMSTTTAAISQVKKPTVDPQEVTANKPTVNLQEVLGHAAPASKISTFASKPDANATMTQNSLPSVKPGATGTISMPRISRPPRPVPQPTATPAGTGAAPAVPKYMATATSAIPKPSAEAGISTATLQYVSTATGQIPGVPKPQQTNSGLDTNTQAVSKEAIEQAKMQSGLGASKPAIKLRPSSVPGKAPAPSAPTIRLAPRTTSSVTPMPPQTPADQKTVPPPVANAASQETVTLSPDDKTQAEIAAASSSGKPDNITVTTKIPRKTISISKKAPNASAISPSAPTETSVPMPSPAAPKQQASPSLHMQNDITNTAINPEGVQGSEQEIELNLQKEKSEEPEQPVAQQPSILEEDTQKYEPNIVFTVIAILAFLAIGYVIFMAARQYFSIWG